MVLSSSDIVIQTLTAQSITPHHTNSQVGYTQLMHCVDMSGPVVWEGLEPTLRILMRTSHLPYMEVHAQVRERRGR